jgi:hypothetical protein
MGHPGIFLFSQPYSSVLYFLRECTFLNLSTGLICQIMLQKKNAEPTCEKSGRETCHWEREKMSMWEHNFESTYAAFESSSNDKCFCAILLAMACPLRCIAVALLGRNAAVLSWFLEKCVWYCLRLGLLWFLSRVPYLVSFFEPIFSKTIHQQTTTVWQKVILGPQVKLWTRK